MKLSFRDGRIQSDRVQFGLSEWLINTIDADGTPAQASLTYIAGQGGFQFISFIKYKPTIQPVM